MTDQLPRPHLPENPSADLDPQQQFAAGLDKALSFQGPLDQFSTEVWQQGLKDALQASLTGGLQLVLGIVILRAIRVVDDNGPGFVLHFSLGAQPQHEFAVAGFEEDPSQTLHLFHTALDVQPVTEMLAQIRLRWPAVKSDLTPHVTYPEDLTGITQG